MDKQGADEKYDLVIVGNGPCTLSFLVNALKKGKLYELLQHKILILDQKQFYGVGKVESYLTSSQSPALEIMRLIVKEPECYQQDFFQDCITQIEKYKEKKKYQELLQQEDLMPQQLKDYKKLQKQYTIDKLIELDDESSEETQRSRRKTDKKDEKNKEKKIKSKFSLNQMIEVKQEQIEILKNAQKNLESYSEKKLSSFGKIKNQLDSENQQEAQEGESDCNSEIMSVNQQDEEFEHLDTDFLFEKTHILDEKKLMDKMKKYTLFAFQDLLKTQTFKSLVSYGVRHEPSNLLAYFMRLVSNSLFYYCKQLMQGQKICHAFCEVLSTQLCQDNFINIRVKNHKDDESVRDQEVSYATKLYQKSVAFIPCVEKKFFTIRTKILILSNGTKPYPVGQDLQNIIPIERTISAFNFIQDQGFLMALSKINQFNCSRIIINGYNNTSFFCGVLLLKGPQIQFNAKEEEMLQQLQVANQKQEKQQSNQKSCEFCCMCMANNPQFQQYMEKLQSLNNKQQHFSSLNRIEFESQSQKTGYSGIKFDHQVQHHIYPNKTEKTYGKKMALDTNYLQQNKQKYRNEAICECPCYCYGNYEPQKYYWNVQDVSIPEFKVPNENEEAPILIFCKKRPVPFFRSKEEMKEVGFSDKYISAQKISEQKEINENYGLKGEARELFIQVATRREKRIKIIEYSSINEIQKFIDDRTYYIEGKGIKYNDIPIKDIQGKNLDVELKDNKRARVDQFERVIFKGYGSAKAIYGLGEGFSNYNPGYYRYINAHGTICLNSILQQLNSKNFDFDDQLFDETSQYQEYDSPQQPIKPKEIEYDQLNRKLETLEQLSFGLDQLSQQFNKTEKCVLKFGKVDSLIQKKSQNQSKNQSLQNKTIQYQNQPPGQKQQ